MDKPVRAANSPIAVKVTADNTYFWCSCGRSKAQPFCDGAHLGTEFSPLKYEAKETKTVYFCGCKVTGRAPLCDGSHNK